MELQEKAKKIQELYQNKAFQELILEEFVDNGIHSIVMTENVDSEPVRDELKARKILSSWMYGIIQEAEIAKTENKE